MNALTFLWELKGGTRNDKNHQDKEYKVSHFTSLGSVTKSSDASKFSTEPVQTFKLGWQYPFVLIKRKGFSFLSKQRLNTRINEVKHYKNYKLQMSRGQTQKFLHEPWFCGMKSKQAEIEYKDQ